MFFGEITIISSKSDYQYFNDFSFPSITRLFITYFKALSPTALNYAPLPHKGKDLNNTMVNFEIMQTFMYNVYNDYDDKEIYTRTRPPIILKSGRTIGLKIPTTLP